MIVNAKPILVFEGGFDDREAVEARDRGYRSHVWVELPNGERYAVVFYDAVRLSQELQDEAEAGNPFIAAPGLIVLPEVTEANMKQAILRLSEEGFFASFKPSSQSATTKMRAV